MNEKEVPFILREGEGFKIDFKEKFDASLVKSMVGFANASGGRIFLGVDDGGVVQGINVTNKLRSQLFDLARNCDPPLKIALESFSFKNISLLIITVFEGENKPYQCSSGFYLRQGANSQKLKRDEIISFSIEEGKIKFDEQFNKRFNFEKDFDEMRFKSYLGLAKIKSTLPATTLLFNLGLCNKMRGCNNAAVLFFAKHPGTFFLTSKVVCVNYQGNEKETILDKKIFDEGIVDNIKEAVNYVKRHINVEYKIKKLEREETLQYPEEAIREAIVNAVMHRDYFDSSGDVVVEVFRNKLTVSNPGGLVKSLQPKDFGKVSRTRNSLIAHLLARTEFVEKLGTGITRMRRSMRTAGLSEPAFDYNGSFFITLHDKTKVGETVGETVGEMVGEKLTLNQQKIVEEISRNSFITANELAEAIGISKRKVEENIAKLKKKSRLERVGSAKGGHWRIIKEKS